MSGRFRANRAPSATWGRTRRCGSPRGSASIRSRTPSGRGLPKAEVLRTRGSRRPPTSPPWATWSTSVLCPRVHPLVNISTSYSLAPRSRARGAASPTTRCVSWAWCCWGKRSRCKGRSSGWARCAPRRSEGPIRSRRGHCSWGFAPSAPASPYPRQIPDAARSRRARWPRGRPPLRPRWPRRWGERAAGREGPRRAKRRWRNCSCTSARGTWLRAGASRGCCSSRRSSTGRRKGRTRTGSPNGPPASFPRQQPQGIGRSTSAS